MNNDHTESSLRGNRGRGILRSRMAALTPMNPVIGAPTMQTNAKIDTKGLPITA
jgi:hypothetical protein